MSACTTGCGVYVDDDVYMCHACLTAWNVSPERARFQASPAGPRCAVALVDFCTRVRAERRPEVP